MDSLTHVVLGAVIGEVAGGKKLGRSAMVVGAGAQCLPDIDIVAATWLDPAVNLMAHRGITHSFLFVIAIGFALMLLAHKLRPGPGLLFWFSFFSIQLFTHVFIDSFNAYGVGFFEPFHDYKYSFHTLYVADPFFTIWPALAVIALLFAKRPSARKAWAISGIALCICYLGYAMYNRSVVVDKVVASVGDSTPMLVTPTPLNSWLWFVAVESAEHVESFRIAHVSVFDESQAISFRTVPIQRELVTESPYTETINALNKFSQRFYVVEQWSDTVVYNDLRFGQMKGWENPDNRFVFHYFVNYPDDNMLVMQRGRFAGWDVETVKRMGQRIFSGDPNRVDENKR